MNARWFPRLRAASQVGDSQAFDACRVLLQTTVSSPVGVNRCSPTIQLGRRGLSVHDRQVWREKRNLDGSCRMWRVWCVFFWRNVDQTPQVARRSSIGATWLIFRGENAPNTAFSRLFEHPPEESCGVSATCCPKTTMAFYFSKSLK